MAATVLTVENRKGGVAKTTTALALAVGLARRVRENDGGNVLIIDMDPQGDACRGLGLEPEGQCVSDVLLGNGSVDQMRNNMLWADRSAEGGPERPNLFIIPATDRLSEAKEDILTEIALFAARSMRSRRPGDGRHLVNILDEKLGLAKDAFDYIILDCPPTLDMLQQAVHQYADYAIVPVKVDYHGASATGRHTANIIEDQAAGIDIQVLAIVPTFVQSRLRLTQSMMQQLTRLYGKRVVTEPIPHTVKIAEAPASGGLTILEYMPKSAAAAAYDTIIDRIYRETAP